MSKGNNIKSNDWKLSFAFTSTRRDGRITVMGNELSESKSKKIINYIKKNLGSKVVLLEDDNRKIYLDIDAFSKTKFLCNGQCSFTNWRVCCYKTTKNGWDENDIKWTRENWKLISPLLRAESRKYYKKHGTFLTEKLKKPKIINKYCFFVIERNSKLFQKDSGVLLCAMKKVNSLRPFCCSLYPSEVIYLTKDKSELFITCINADNKISLTRHGNSKRMFEEGCIKNGVDLDYVYEKEWFIYLMGEKIYKKGLENIKKYKGKKNKIYKKDIEKRLNNINYNKSGVLHWLKTNTGENN